MKVEKQTGSLEFSRLTHSGEHFKFWYILYLTCTPNNHTQRCPGLQMKSVDLYGTVVLHRIVGHVRNNDTVASSSLKSIYSQHLFPVSESTFFGLNIVNKLMYFGS